MRLVYKCEKEFLNEYLSAIESKKTYGYFQDFNIVSASSTDSNEDIITGIVEGRNLGNVNYVDVNGTTCDLIFTGKDVGYKLRCSMNADTRTFRIDFIAGDIKHTSGKSIDSSFVEGYYPSVHILVTEMFDNHNLIVAPDIVKKVYDKFRNIIMQSLLVDIKGTSDKQRTISKVNFGKWIGK